MQTQFFKEKKMGNDTNSKEIKLNTRRTLLLGVVFLSISLLNGAHDNVTNVILNYQFEVNATLRGLIMAIDNILALFMLPVFGRLSDACNSRWGKRKPYVFWGTVAGCVFLMLFPLALKLNNLALFIIVICMFLIALGTYRSAGVALVADVTIKPLRSKANAIINLMGAVAFIIGQLFTMFLYKDIKADGTRAIPIFWYYFGFVIVTVVCLIIYMIKVPERKWTLEREKLEDELHLEDEEVVEGVKVKLDKPHMRSLLLILLSIILWTFGYNAVTTNYGVYAKTVLGTADGGFAGPTLIAGIAGFASYIPVGILASKIGRRKTIMTGLIIATISFALAIFVRAGWLMYVVFILVGIAQATIIVNTLPMVVEFANKNTIGQFTGYYYIATQSAQALSPLAIGLIMDLLSTELGSGIAGNGGLLALFPYSTIFVALAFIPLLFTKYGDAKAIPTQSKLEQLAVDD